MEKHLDEPTIHVYMQYCCEVLFKYRAYRRFQEWIRISSIVFMVVWSTRRASISKSMRYVEGECLSVLRMMHDGYNRL